jgi:hypothetical protein
MTTPTSPQFKLRLPEALKSRLESEAQASGRTVTSEIVWRLESTLSISASKMLDSRFKEAEELAIRDAVMAKDVQSVGANLAVQMKSKDPQIIAARAGTEALLNRLISERAVVALQLSRVTDEIAALIRDLQARHAALPTHKVKNRK